MTKRKIIDNSSGAIAGYIRKSDVKWPDGCATPDQRIVFIEDLKRIRMAELVNDAARNGDTITEWYDDMDISGRAEFLAKRVDFDRLTVKAQSGQVRKVYARELSRLFRDVIGQEIWFESMSAANVTVHVQDLPETHDPSSTVMIRQMFGAVNQAAATRASILTKSNLREAIKLKKWVGRRKSLWGLRNCITHFDYDEATADKIVFVYEQFIACGGKWAATSIRLNEAWAAREPRATLTPQGKRWNHSSVHRLMQTPLYHRRIVYGDDIDMEASDRIPQVVPPELIAEADRLIELRKPIASRIAGYFNKTGPPPKYTWGPFLICGICGSRMRAVYRKDCPNPDRWITWHCRSGKDRVGDCVTSGGFAQSRLDALVRECVMQALTWYGERCWPQLADEDAKRARPKPRRADKDSAARRLEKIAEEEKRLVHLYAKGYIVSMDDLEASMSELRTEKSRIESQRRLVLSDNPPVTPKIAREDWATLLSVAGAAWLDESRHMEIMDETKHGLLRALGIRIACTAELIPNPAAKVLRVSGPLSVVIEIPSMGLVGDSKISLTETPEQFEASKQARNARQYRWKKGQANIPGNRFATTHNPRTS